MILIQAAQMEESIIFSVYNSGNPIDEMKMEDLNRITHMTQEEMKQTFFTEKGGFGIYNIVTRMRMAYGAAFEIHYSKPESGGTLCTIKIPLEVN